MLVIRLADINIAVENKYAYVKAMCRNFITESTADFSISSSDEEIQAEDRSGSFDMGYLESLSVYRKITEKIIEYNGFLLHGVVVEVDNCGIAFLARSGVGKSTHARLWQEHLKDKLKIINGDKPLIRIIDGKVFAYGTPWAGKENIYSNTKTELKKICFIERSADNECIRLEKTGVLKKLIPQIYKSENMELYLKTLEFVSTIIEKAEFYLIKCNTDKSAAEVAYEKVMQ